MYISGMPSPSWPHVEPPLVASRTMLWDSEPTNWVICRIFSKCRFSNPDFSFLSSILLHIVCGQMHSGIFKRSILGFYNINSTIPFINSMILLLIQRYLLSIERYLSINAMMHFINSTMLFIKSMMLFIDSMTPFINSMMHF